MQIIEVHGEPEAMRWCDDHGLNPHDFKPTVTINDDGTMTFKRMLRTAHGEFLIRNGEVATESFTMTPNHPFPVQCLHIPHQQ